MKKYEPSVIGIEEDLAFTKNNVWLYVKLPPLPYEFIEWNSREALAESLNIGFESLLTSQDKSLECHLIVTSTPFDHEHWKLRLSAFAKRNEVSPIWDSFIDRMEKHVEKQSFRTREVFLGILLGNRSEFRGTGIFSALRETSNALTSAFGVSDHEIPDKEIEYWKARGTQYKNILLGGSLLAEEIISEDIATLLKETLWPGMKLEEVPFNDRQKWGKGEISGLAIADIHNNSKFLKISQFDNGETVEGYKATLCFSRFPDEIPFPEKEPWIHYSSLLSNPATIYSRFTIEPSRKVQKVVEQKEKDALDQWNNSGGTNAPLAIMEQLEVAQQLKYTLGRERKPWIFGRHRIVVTGKTQKELEKHAQEVIDHYKTLGIEVVWPSGDQLKLLLESQPGDSVRSSAYYQRQELGIIAVGMPTGSGKVGDAVDFDRETGKPSGWLGPYLGRTNSRVEEPVFFSLHAAIAKNNPPGCVITGAPGGGKSFTGMNMTYMMALQGVWTVLIDPKGDAVHLPTLPGLEGKARVFDLSEGSEGLFDPFMLADELPDQKLLAIEVIKLFLGGNIGDKANNALMECVGEISTRPSPSLYAVVDLLRSHRSEEGKALGNSLNIIRDLPFAKLCFAPNRNPDAQPMKAEDGLTVISLKNLDLPADSKRENYSTKNFLAVGIMYLLTYYTESLMYSADSKHPKAVVIDEAWAITSTPQGANMIPRLARMGRSLNTGIILISQNAADFLNLTNSMPYRLCFGTKDGDEMDNVSKILGLETDDQQRPLKGNLDTIFNLGRGECLMRDPDGRIARVKVDNWDPTMFEVFNTNPESRIDRRGEKDNK